MTTTNEKQNSRRLGAVIFVALVIMAAGGLGNRWLENALVAVDARPVALPQPLASFPHEIGVWRGVDVALDERVLEVAGNDDQIYRRYSEASTRNTIDFYLAFAAHPAKMLGHRPRVCYPANGWTHVETTKETVLLPEGGSLECLVHYFTRNDPEFRGIVVLNYYILQGRHITDWHDFWGPRWRMPNLWRDPNFYVAQIQICSPLKNISGRRQTEDLVRQFAGQVAAKITAILPIGK
jgi:EpsI family protein